MLKRTVTQQIERALEQGDWSAIVEALDKFPDLRWGDLPSLSKKALSAFAIKLPMRSGPCKHLLALRLVVQGG